jgi:hypothetical protein
MSIYYRPTRRGSIEGSKTYVKDPKRTTPVPAKKSKPPKPKYSEVMPVTCVAFTIPLLIRVMELVHEEVKTDEDLHYLVEGIISLGLNELLDMNDYEDIANVLEEVEVEEPEEYPTEEE